MTGLFGPIIGGMLALIPSLLCMLFDSLGLQPFVLIFDAIVAAIVAA